MKNIRFLLPLYIMFFSSFAFSQRGKNGPLVISSLVEVNEYTVLNATCQGNTIKRVGFVQLIR